MQSTLPVLDEEGLIAKSPVCILNRRMRKSGNVAVTEILVQWLNEGTEDATWK